MSTIAPVTTLENKKAQKLIDKILADLNRNGIILNSVVDDLKSLRPFSLEEKVPLIVKVLRLTYEHLEEYESFNIPIPNDEPIEEEGESPLAADFDAKESLHYLISLLKDLENKVNVADLRAYSNALKAY